MAKKNYFQGNSEHPQHISVGAIVLNDKNEVCCHHFFAKDLKGYWVEEELDDFYLLMRETIRPNETLEQTLERGLMEEFGITATMIDYVGSIQSRFMHKGITVEKTTLSFLSRLVEQDHSKRDTSDIEGTTKIEWKTIDFLIPLMKQQAQKYGRTDIDESSILERTRSLIS